jgi:hypothetical protein
MQQEVDETVSPPAESNGAARTFLGREVLERDDVRYDEFQIPEWNDTWARIRSWTTKQRERFENEVTEVKNGKTRANVIGMRAKAAVLSLCDAHGRLIMTEKDVPALSGKDSGAVNRIFRRVCKLNGILQSEADLEEAVGNSGETRDDDS